MEYPRLASSFTVELLPVPGAPVRTILRKSFIYSLLKYAFMKKSGFKKLLEENYSWPCLYMFKFICPAKNENIAHLESLFNSESSEVIIRQSSKGNFVSVTAKEIMLSPEKVLNRYKEVEQIPGLLSL